MSQHLSDEAVAACADGVLTGLAKTRAERHCAGCAECADAVRGQREAVLALRTAPAPELPGGLLDRLRGLPQVTPIATPPTVVMPDGTPMLSTTGLPGTVAAFVPPQRDSTPRERTAHRVSPLVTSFAAGAAAVVLVGAVAAGATSGDPTAGTTERDDAPQRATTVQHRVPAGGTNMAPPFETADVFRSGGR